MKLASLVFTTLVVCGQLGCGDHVVTTTFDAAVVLPSFDAGPDAECSPATFAIDCPARACEVATGCAAGTCEYGPFACGRDGVSCPLETCRADMVEGEVVNECVVIEGAPCGTGASCVGDECIVSETGLSLRGALETAEIRAASGALTLRGELSASKPGTAPKASTSTLRLTGGLQTH